MRIPRTQTYGETKYKRLKIYVLDRANVLQSPQTQTYGETNCLKEKLEVLDRTKVLHGPQTQTYGETNYFKEKNTSFGQNQGIAWSSDSNLWGNQLLKEILSFG